MSFILATGSLCANCGPAKNILRKAGVEFEEFNVESEDAEAQLPAGIRGVPTLIKDGEIVAVGVMGVKNYVSDNHSS